jgi:anaerobic selenocysteine-containing dehydrogenase
MDRRDFIKITAATGAGATLAGCGHPEDQLIRFIPEEAFYPGVAELKPGICPSCPAGCGIQVRVMDGDAEVVRNGQRGVLRMGLAKKLEGNPVHPVSRGKLCARGQAAIQVTYHPDRIRHPLRRAGPRGTGPFEEISWDEAMAGLVDRLDALAAANERGALGFLTRPLRGQRQRLIAGFLEDFGAPPPIAFEVFSDEVLRQANARSFGYAQLPTFDLARSRYVLSFGADFLGVWNSPVAQNRAYGEMRQSRPGVRAKFVQAEPRMSQTGANADEWVPVTPGAEGVLALSIAHVILQADPARRRAAAAGAGRLIDGWDQGLPAYSPARAEPHTGVAAARVERLAREFAANGPAVAVIGGAPLAHTNGMFQALAVNALNALAGTVGEPGGIFFTPRLPGDSASPTPGGSIREAAAAILSAARSPVQLLLLNDANPVFGAPPAWRIAEALQRIPTIVSFGSFLDETSVLADLILPDHSFLESWVDDIPESGTLLPVASLAPPAMRPLHNTRAMPDVLLEAGRRLQRPLSLQHESYEAVLRSSFMSLPQVPETAASGAAGSETGTDAWSVAQRQGGWWPDASPARPVRVRETASAPAAEAEAQFDGAPAQYPLHFLPFASQAFFDGSLAHLPWLQELPDVISTAMWSAWVELHPATAAALGIRDGDLVEIASTQGAIQAPALLSPGIAPNVAAMPVGQGHQTFTRYASGRGANPLSILAPLTESETGLPAWSATRVRITRLGGPPAGSSPLVRFATGLRDPHDTRR